MHSAAKFRANKYDVVRCLWKGMGVPAVMYAANVLNWTQQDFDKLEVAQNKIGRVALGANRIVGAEAIRGDMGWSTFGERINKAVLSYKARLERMQEGRWAKKVYNHNFRNSKWIKSCAKMVRKCNLKKEAVAGGGSWRLADEAD